MLERINVIIDDSGNRDGEENNRGVADDEGK